MRALSSQKTWLEPLLGSNSPRASAMVPYALKGSTGWSLKRPASCKCLNRNPYLYRVSGTSYRVFKPDSTITFYQP